MDRATAHPKALEPALGIPGFTYADLHDPHRLAQLTQAFDDAVAAGDSALFARYAAHRAGQARLRGPAESELLIDLARHLSGFVGKLAGVEGEQRAHREAAGREAPIFRVKRDFVQRRVFKKGAKAPQASFAELDARVRPLLEALALHDPRVSQATADEELQVALALDALLDAEGALAVRFDEKKPGELALQPFFVVRDLFAALQRGVGGEDFAFEGEAQPAELVRVRALLDLLGQWLHALALHPRAPQWPLLKLPHSLDYQALVPLRRPRPERPEQLEGHAEHQRRRDGFTLTDLRMTPREVRSEIDYCILCHEREKDSCARGFAEKEGPHYKKNPLGIPLTGCPLEERIMHRSGPEWAVDTQGPAHHPTGTAGNRLRGHRMRQGRLTSKAAIIISSSLTTLI